MKKVIFIITILFLSGFSFFFIRQINAQTQSISQNQPVISPRDQHVWVQTVTIDILSALTCQLSGIDPSGGGRQCVGVNPKTGSLGYYQGGNGTIGMFGDLIAQTYTPIPASTSRYMAYVGSKLNMAPPAYAQQQPIGFGFTSINFLLTTWTVFRNLVYILFVLVFVVIGFMIMLRVKIDPRTVMSIENQIPKIIVGLILVTFSFAIAGLLIDIMWVGIYVIINVFASINPNINANLGQLSSDLYGRNVLEFVQSNIHVGTSGGGLFSVVSRSSQAVSSVVASMLNTDGTGRLVGGLIAGIIGSLTAGVACSAFPIANGVCAGVGGIVGGVTGAFKGELIGGVAYIFAVIIIFVAILFALFRLWFSLIQSYVYLLLHITLAPFWILLGLLPGASINFEAWVREIASNLVAFPATIAMFLLAKVFMDSFVSPTAPTSSVFVPPLIGNPGNPSQIGALIGLGIILLTPQIVNILKEALKAPQFKYAAAIGQAIGVGSNITSRTMMGGAQTLIPYKNLMGTAIVPLHMRFLRAFGLPGGGGGH